MLAVHTSAWGPAAPFQAIDQVARFCVPAFVILTGTVLAYRYTGRPLGGRFAQRRLARTLLPWLVWVPIYVCFDVLSGQLQPQAAHVMAFLALGAGHLWFLLLVPQFYLLFAVWPQRHRWPVAGAALLLQTALCLIRLYVQLPGWQSQVMLAYANEIFPFWIGYFAVGIAVGDAMHHPGALRRAINVWRWQLAVVGVVATAASGYLLVTLHYPGAAFGESFLDGTGSFLNPALPLFVFAVSALIATTLPPVMRASRRVTQAVELLSNESLGIYIVHPVFLFLLANHFLGWWMAHSGIYSLAAWLVLVLLTLAASIVAVRLLRATPAAATLGSRRAGLPFTRGSAVAGDRAA